MKKLISITLLAVAMIAATGCTTPPEQIARNVIATGSGAIASAQADYTKQCIANPAGKICGAINRTVDAQNVAVTALESYCGFQLSGVLPDPATKCVPVKSALGGLNVAITNLNQLIGELKSAANLKSRKLPPLQTPMPEPAEATLTPGAIALALLGLRTLLDSILKGKAGEVSDDAIAAIQAGIVELETVQGQEITMGQLEGLRLHKLWPDVAGDTGAAGAGTQTGSGGQSAG